MPTNRFLPSFSNAELDASAQPFQDSEVAGWYAFSNPRREGRKLSFRRDRPWYQYLLGTMSDAAVLFSTSTFLTVIDTMLRSYSQILFMNNPITGACFLGAYLGSSPSIGLMSLLGASTSNLFSWYLRQHPQVRQNGLFGYNGALTGAALALFQHGDSFDDFNWSVPITVIAASAASTLFQVFLGQILTTNYGVATFTFAFHFATWICLLVGQKALYMPNNTEFISPSLVVPVQIGQRRALDIDERSFFEGVGNNIAQVFLLGDWWVGVIVVCGTAFASPISAVMVLAGSLISSCTALAIGVETDLIYGGLMGYNGVVVMVAIGGMFWCLSVRTITFAILATMQATVMTTALSTFLAPFSLPALTFPAALTCTIWTLINPVLHSSDSFFITLDHMTLPEDHIRRLRVASQISKVLLSDPRSIAGSVKEMDQFEKVVLPCILCALAAEGKARKIQTWIDSGVVDVNSADFDGRTALHLAAAEGNEIVARLLVQMRANINPMDRFGNTPLEDAVRENQTELIKFLRSEGGKIHRPSVEMGTRLCDAASRGNQDDIYNLCLAGIHPDTSDYDGRTALHIAVGNSNISLVRRLLIAGVNPHRSPDVMGNTPYGDAEKIGDPSILKILNLSREEILGSVDSTGTGLSSLLLGARSSRKGSVDLGEEHILLEEEEVFEEALPSRWSENAFIATEDFFARMIGGDRAKPKKLEELAFQNLLRNLAAAKGFLDPLRKMMASSTEHGDYDKRTPLHIAASSGHLDVVRYLLYSGAQINAIDRFGESPLHTAVSHGHDAVANLLATSGGKVFLSPSQIVLDLVMCVSKEDPSNFELRLKYGWNPSVADYDGRTAFHTLVQKNVNPSWINSLLHHNADLDLLDRWGKSPRMLLEEKGIEIHQLVEHEEQMG